MPVKKVHIGEKPGEIVHNLTVKLGTAGDRITQGDFGKPMKLGGDSQYVRCVDGDPIEGIVSAIEVFTADQITVGTIKAHGKPFHKEAIMVGTGWVIGDHVVAAVQAAAGTRNDTVGFPRPKVKKTADGLRVAGSFNWRIVAVVPGYVLGANNGVVTLEAV